MDHLYAVILAGGSGTRFWPASRRSRPKQFLAIGSPSPLLATTVERLDGLIPPERILIVTGEEHAALVGEVCPSIPADNVLAEPMGRNTLPCVAWAAAELLRRDPDGVHAVLPADHVIEPQSAFRDAVATAGRAAARAPRGLFTFGVRPTFPATGFGYILAGEAVPDSEGLHRVERFVEKPDLARAQEFVADPAYLWNSGMFVWHGRAIAAALEAHAPATWSVLRDATPSAARAAYGDIAADSVDTGILERWDDVRVLPIDYGWSDVGAWTALPDVLPADAAGNTASGGGQLIAEDSTGCIAHGEDGQLTALLGVHDLVVVQSGGITMVCPKGRAQEVRKLVERARSEAPDKLL